MLHPFYVAAAAAVCAKRKRHIKDSLPARELRDVLRLIAKGKATIYCRSSNYKPAVANRSSRRRINAPRLKSRRSRNSSDQRVI